MAAVGKLNHQTYPSAQYNEPRPYHFDFSVELDGSNDPTNQYGRNVKVTRVSTGVYDIELPKKFAQMVRCVCTLEGTLGQDAKAEVVSYTSSTKKVRVRVVQRADVAYETVAIASEAGALTTAGAVVYAEDTGTTPVGALTIIRTGTPSAGQVTVTYTAGVPSFETAAADAIDQITVLQVPSEGVVADLDGPRLNVSLVMQLSTDLAKTWS